MNSMAALSTPQLWRIVHEAPDRRVLWTEYERAAEDELDRRQRRAA